MLKTGSNQYTIEGVQGRFELQNQNGDVVGYVKSVTTQSGSKYDLRDPDDVGNFTALDIPQLFMANGSIRAMGNLISQSEQVLTSPIRHLHIQNQNGQVFDVPVGSVISAPKQVMLLNSQEQTVYVDGNFAVEHFHDQAEIDAHFDRQVRVREKGLDVNPRDLRWSNFPVLGNQ